MFGREHGSKVGSGGTNSGLAAELHRKALVRNLTLDKIDVSKDPYIVKNHLGSYDCKLCLSTHPNEGNYLAHTKGKRHLAGLARRAARDAQLNQGPQPLASSSAAKNKPKFVRKAKIGRPVYRYLKQRDPESGQYSLLFMIEYPEILDGLQPRIRVLSAFEQKLERTADKNWQYLLFAAEPYHTIAFRIPNLPIEREFDPTSGAMKFWTNWDAQKKIFSLQLYFKQQDLQDEQSNGINDEYPDNYDPLQRPSSSSANSMQVDEDSSAYENPEM